MEFVENGKIPDDRYGFSPWAIHRHRQVGCHCRSFHGLGFILGMMPVVLSEFQFVWNETITGVIHPTSNDTDTAMELTMPNPGGYHVSHF
jgi:hypothetical protein